MRILVAEDVPANQALLRLFLEAAGHQVDMVADGAAALGAAQSGAHAVAVLDLRMPLLDGFAVARAIRALRPPACDLPLLALTADSTEATRAEAAAAGFSGVMTKPFTAQALLDALAAHARAV